MFCQVLSHKIIFLACRTISQSAYICRLPISAGLGLVAFKMDDSNSSDDQLTPTNASSSTSLDRISSTSAVNYRASSSSSASNGPTGGVAAGGAGGGGAGQSLTLPTPNALALDNKRPIRSKKEEAAAERKVFGVIPDRDTSCITPQALAQLAGEPEIKVVTYRDFMHTFPDPASPSSSSRSGFANGSRSNDSDSSADASQPVAFTHMKRPTSLQSRIMQKAFTWFIFHHWGLFYATVFTYIYILRNMSWTVVALATALLALYVPTYLDRADEACGGRRIWPALQKHWVWDLPQYEVHMEVVRLAKLDPYKQYMFGAYPHGMLLK